MLIAGIPTRSRKSPLRICRYAPARAARHCPAAARSISASARSLPPCRHRRGGRLRPPRRSDSASRMVEITATISAIGAQDRQRPAASENDRDATPGWRCADARPTSDPPVHLKAWRPPRLEARATQRRCRLYKNSVRIEEPSAAGSRVLVRRGRFRAPLEKRTGRDALPGDRPQVRSAGAPYGVGCPSPFGSSFAKREHTGAAAREGQKATTPVRAGEVPVVYVPFVARTFLQMYSSGYWILQLLLQRILQTLGLTATSADVFNPFDLLPFFAACWREYRVPVLLRLWLTSAASSLRV